MADVKFFNLDLKGTSPANKVVNEPHPLVQIPGRQNRVFVPKHGGFYTESLKLRDANGQPLYQDVHYVPTYHYDILSRMTGKEIMALVVITDPNVKQPVYADLQYVGGFFSPDVDELKAVMDKLALDELHFKFEDIIGKPEAYVPLPHEDEYWQLYGCDYIVTELNRVADVIPLGNSTAIEEAGEYWKSYIVDANGLVDEYYRQINAHINDTNNPHKTNKITVGLNQLNNWPISNDAQIMSNNANTYLPIGGVFLQLQTTLDSLRAHVQDLNNPHGTTADQLGIPLKTQVDEMLRNRLRINAVAKSTVLLGGRDATDMWNSARWNLPASNITSGRFPMNLLGSGVGIGSNDYVLVGNNTFRHIDEDLIPNAYGPENPRPKIVYFGGLGGLGMDPVHQALQAFADIKKYPIGTQAIGHSFTAVNSFRQVSFVRFLTRVGATGQIGDWSLLTVAPEMVPYG